MKGDVYASIYLVKLDARYLDTSRSTWGLGEISEDQQEYPMSFKLARYYGTLYRRIVDPIYLGFGYHLDDYMELEGEGPAQWTMYGCVDHVNG